MKLCLQIFIHVFMCSHYLNLTIKLFLSLGYIKTFIQELLFYEISVGFLVHVRPTPCFLASIISLCYTAVMMLLILVQSGRIK